MRTWFCIFVATLDPFSFEILYYCASKDLNKNANLIGLGMVAKAATFSITVLDVALRYISWQIILTISGDLIFAILFYKALQNVADTAKKK